MALILPYHAKPEQVEYTRRYQAERRRRLRNDYFADKSCIKCGSGIFLELHHRNPHDKASHRDLWLWCEERMRNELAKCDVLCSTCHDKESAYTLLLMQGWVGQRIT